MCFCTAGIRGTSEKENFPFSFYIAANTRLSKSRNQTLTQYVLLVFHVDFSEVRQTTVLMETDSKFTDEDQRLHHNNNINTNILHLLQLCPVYVPHL